jgi:nitrite reductase/ring-hydroxylating ferredoxin subunit
MDAPNREFALAGTLEELKRKGRLVVHGRHRPILVVYDRGRVLALDNRCPHMGFPLERGSVEDGILTCHWHHARFDLESGSPSICGRTRRQPVRSRCAMARSG